MVSFSEDDDELVDEVRAALGEMDAEKVPTSTIIQSKDRTVVPYITDNAPSSPDQDKVDNAIIMMTAEKAYKAWLAKTRMDAAQISIYTDPESLRESLEAKANAALNRLGISRTISDEPGPAPFVTHSDGFW